MSERTPSAHSMTVETPDLESVVTISNLAEKVFLLERWKAEAVVTISKLEGERDTLRHNLDALLVAGFNTPPGKCSNCAELRSGLEAAEASIDSLRDSLHAREIRLEAFERERSDVRAEVEGLMKATDFQRDRANRLHRMFVKALDAA